MIQKSFSYIKLSLLSALFFLATLALKTPEMQKRSDYLPPPVAIQHLSVGMKTQLADSFWLRAVQDFDFCEKTINENECQGKSWLFQVLNLATDLDPKFAPAMYQFAGLALTVLVSDYPGATVIFDKAVAQYPDNWELNYAAGYHALYEEKDKVKAARLYKAAGDYGAPKWVYSLASGLSNEGGDREFAQLILQTLEKSTGSADSEENQKLIKRIRQKLSQ